MGTHVAHHRGTGVHADAHEQILADALADIGTHGRQAFLAAQGRPHPMDGMVGLLKGSVPEGDDRIPFVLVDGAAFLLDYIGHG